MDSAGSQANSVYLERQTAALVRAADTRNCGLESHIGHEGYLPDLNSILYDTRITFYRRATPITYYVRL